MAVYDNSSSSAQNSGTSLTLAHTVGTDNGRLLVVALHYRAHNTPAAHATGVTYNGVAMLFIRREVATDRDVELWYLFNPASGTHNVVVTMSADPENMTVGAASYSAMDSDAGILDQAGAVDENARGAGFPDVETISMSTRNATDLIVAALSNYPNGSANNPTIQHGTQRYNLNTPVPNIAGTFADSIGVFGPTTISWTSAQEFSWSIAAVIFAGSRAEQYRVEVDWDGDGDFDEANEDISADALSATTKRGREWESNLIGRSIAGSIQIELDNAAGVYSSLNPASPIYGLVANGRRVRISMLAPFAGVMGVGFLTGLVPHTGALPQATLTAKGAFALLGEPSRKISPPPLDNQLSGYVVNTILDAARWPPASSQLLLNPGWESGAAPGTSWVDATFNLTGTWTMNASHSEGAQSLQLAVTAVAAAGYKLAEQVVPLPFLALKAATLRLTYDYYIVSHASGTNLKALIFVAPANEAGAQLSTVTAIDSPTPTGGWITDQVLDIPCPDGTTALQVYAGIHLISGAFDSTLTVRFDNFRLTWPAGDAIGGRDIDAGEVPIGHWAQENKGALEALQEMEETEVGFLFEGLNWQVVFESRFARATEHTEAVTSFSDAAGELMAYGDVEQAEPLDKIYNIISADIQPAHAGSAGTVLWTQRETPFNLTAGASVRYKATIPSGDLYANPWITPVVGTDVTQTGVANSDISISNVVKSAKSMLFTIKNNHATTTASITLAQARGTPLIADEPIGIESHDQTSIGTYGPREFPLPSPYYLNSVYAQASADYFISQYKDPRPILKVLLLAGYIPSVLQQAVTRDISDRVHFQALGIRTMLGISQDFYIESVAHKISRDAPLETTWELSPAGLSTYWVLGTSQLGVSTRLAW